MPPQPSEPDPIAIERPEVVEDAQPLFTTSKLEEVFSDSRNGNCHDASRRFYAENDVSVWHCTFSNSPVYFVIHKYAGVSSTDYLAQYPNSLEYRSGLDGPDGQLCVERYLNTFTSDDVDYNSKIAHFLSMPFLVEVIAPRSNTAELISSGSKSGSRRTLPAS
jgi:hypothetical protein